MISKESNLFICDNSGGLTCYCIGFFRGLSVGYCGDPIIVSVSSVKKIIRAKHGSSKIFVKDGDVLKALIVQTRSSSFRFGGNVIKFFYNMAVFLKGNFRTKDVPYGTRISTTVSFDLRTKGFVKVMSIAPGFL